MTEELEKSASLDTRAVAAKDSEAITEQFIEDFKPFLHSRVAKYSTNTDSDRREELFSVAMMAFHESIQTYDAAKGHFFPFAENVIRRRMIDLIRGAYRNDADTVPLDPLADEDDEQYASQSAAISELSIRAYDEQRRRETLVDEIEQYKAELSTWGISMETLSKHSPKHKALRETYRQVITQVSKSDDIVQTIQVKRYFPVKAISEISGLPQKNVERARIFILASLIIKMGDYDLLSDYVSDGRLK